MILLTGANGFLGSYLLYELVSHGRDVRIVIREKANLDQIRLAFKVMNKKANDQFEDYLKKIQITRGNFTDEQLYPVIFEGIDEVFHVASKVSFRKKDREEILRLNVEGTVLLLDYCLANDIRKFHFTSSIASLNRNVGGVISDAFNGEKKKFTSAYSRSKYLAENEVWKAYKKGLSGIIVNPGVVLGPVMDYHESVRVFKTIQNGFNYFTSGANGYVDVRDVASIMFLLSSDEKFYNERYLLVSESVFYRDLFSWMANDFGVEPPQKLAGKNLSFVIAFLDYLYSSLTGKKQVITKDLVNLVNSEYYFDSSKVVKALDFHFRPVKDSVRETIRYLNEATDEF